MTHEVHKLYDPSKVELRETVCTQTRMRAQVTAAAASPSARGRLHFLDFFPALLTPDGSGLAPDLAFDGTHMAPAYVRHLDAALSGVV